MSERENSERAAGTSHRIERSSAMTPIVTFYSYKGGVGRTMALANIAVLLARQHGRKVLAVDWDLEAPGLHRFLGVPEGKIRDGVIDYLLAYKQLLQDLIL